MKLLLSVAVAAGLCCSGVALAETAKAPTAQQSKMTDCNKQAAGLKGADRKAAMKSCLSGNATAATPAAPATPATPAVAPATPATPAVPAAASTQQNKMADCNKQATGMKGADRKTFMSSCLSGKAMPAATPAAPAVAAPAAPAAPATPSTAAVDKNGKPLTAQQMKMKECSAANKGKKGDDYKQAQSACLKK